MHPVGPNAGYLDATDDTLRWLPQAGTWTFAMRFSDVRYSFIWGKTGNIQVEVPPPSHPPANLTGWQPSLIGALTPFPVARNPPLFDQVFEGQNLQLYLYAAYAGFTYQWQRQATSNLWVDIVGATSQQLSFYPLNLTDSGTYRLTADFDGNECSTTSMYHTLNVLPFPPFSISATVSSNRQIQINGSAVAYVSYEIQTSTDLIQWTNLVTLTNAPTNWEFVDTNVAIDGLRFYRARVVR